MDDQIIIEFLRALPDAFLWFLVFILSYIVEAFYTLWIRRTTDGKAIRAANWSTLLYIFSMVSLAGVLSVNNILIFPSALGIWLGSYFTIKMDIKSKK